MSKKIPRGVLYVVLFIVFLRACGAGIFHEHDWQAATCTEPQFCSSCKAESGGPLGHDWAAATCTSYQMCQRCGTTGGQRLDHAWVDATCTEPEHCSVCGEKRHWYSMTSSHDWQRSTCTEPKVCAVCGEIGDGPGEHSTPGYGGEIVIEATCQSGGVAARQCRYCEAVVEVPTERKLCTPGDWTIIQEATPDASGVRVRVCTVCGQETDRHEYKYSTPTAQSATGNSFNTYDNEAQQQTSAQYVLNTSSGKFHRPSCRDVPKISPANYSTSNRSRSDLISGGWDPCGHCSP